MRGRPAIVAVACATVLTGAPVAAEAQVVLDRIVSRVDGRIVTQSDVERARRLKLVDDPSSEESARLGLEDRLLILAEIARLPPLAASEQDLGARQAEWESALGGGQAAAAALADVGMSEGELRAWLRDDVRIRLHLRRQFGQVADADRSRVVADWINRLRQRAGLKPR